MILNKVPHISELISSSIKQYFKWYGFFKVLQILRNFYNWVKRTTPSLIRRRCSFNISMSATTFLETVFYFNLFIRHAIKHKIITTYESNRTQEWKHYASRCFSFKPNYAYVCDSPILSWNRGNYNPKIVVFTPLLFPVLSIVCRYFCYFLTFFEVSLGTF